MNKTNYTPIEMPVGNKYGSDYFVLRSFKLGRVIKLYSKLEYKNWLTLEMNPEVLTFCEQPYKAEMFVQGQKKVTIFDMWVKYKNGNEEFQEIKYIEQLSNPKNKDYERCKQQIDFQKKWCKVNKIHYIVRNENDIELGECHMENLLHMSSLIKHSNHFNAKYYYKKLEDLLDKDSYTIGELYQNVSQRIFYDEFLAIISFAYYDGIITLNIMDKPLSLNTEVKVYGK
jgi:hypothetical protein